MRQRLLPFSEVYCVLFSGVKKGYGLEKQIDALPGAYCNLANSKSYGYLTALFSAACWVTSFFQRTLNSSFLMHRNIREKNEGKCYCAIIVVHDLFVTTTWVGGTRHIF